MAERDPQQLPADREPASRPEVAEVQQPLEHTTVAARIAAAAAADGELPGRLRRMSEAQRARTTLAMQRRYGNALLQRSLAAKSYPVDTAPPTSVRSPLLQRQDAPPTGEAQQPKEKRYTVTLSTGNFSGLTEPEALGKLWESYDMVDRQVELMRGEHERLKLDRDSNLFVGLGGVIADTFIGRDIPAVSMWDRPRNLLTAAKFALTARAVEEAANTLIQAGQAYNDCRDTYRTYKDELEMGGGATQVAIAAIPVAALVIGLAVVFVAPAAGGAAAGGAGTAEAAGGATAAAEGATAAAEGATAAGTTAAGGAVVGGGVGGTAATATTIATGETVSAIAGRAAALMAGNPQALTAFLTGLAATPSGRQAMLHAAQLAVVSMQSPGVLQREFQFLKQLSEILFLFARGGG